MCHELQHHPAATNMARLSRALHQCAVLPPWRKSRELVLDWLAAVQATAPAAHSQQLAIALEQRTQAQGLPTVQSHLHVTLRLCPCAMARAGSHPGNYGRSHSAAVRRVQDGAQVAQE